MIRLYFIHEASPELERVEFSQQHEKIVHLSVRGKTPGTYRTSRTFQWTSAVQALALLFVRARLATASRGMETEFEASISGGRGSLASSLEFAIEKEPLWLVDMFGPRSDGHSYLRQMLLRSTARMKRTGEASLRLKDWILTPGVVSIWCEDKEISDFDGLLGFQRALEKALGELALENPRKRPVPASERPDPPVAAVLKPADTNRPCYFKTSSVFQPTTEGDVYVRAYELEGELALVTLFCPVGRLNTSRSVPVRIHSACAPSETLGTTDCDCRSQLDHARLILRNEHGVLIYLFQEGRGAGLYSKYLGMSISEKHRLDSYAAFEKLSLPADKRDYALAGAVLRDLGITKVELLSNNSAKANDLRARGIAVQLKPCFGEVLPDNLEYLYSKMKKGGHSLESLLGIGEESFSCSRKSNLQPPARLWIFAGDDTLWEDNVRYEDLIRQFLDLASYWRPSLSRAQLRGVIDSVEKEMTSAKGFGEAAFESSLRTVYSKLVAGDPQDFPEPKEFFNSLRARLSNGPIELVPTAKQILLDLKARGDSLALCVQGPVDEQLSKIARSGLATMFDAIWVVQKKSKEVVTALVREAFPCARLIRVVGSNVKYDLLPFADLANHSYFFQNPDSWHLLDDSGLVPTGCSRLVELRSLLDEFQIGDTAAQN